MHEKGGRANDKKGENKTQSTNGGALLLKQTRGGEIKTWGGSVKVGRHG